MFDRSLVIDRMRNLQGININEIRIAGSPVDACTTSSLNNGTPKVFWVPKLLGFGFGYSSVELPN
jgi:hypothetical protein